MAKCFDNSNNCYNFAASFKTTSNNLKHKAMISAEEAKAYTKEFKPNPELVNEVERQIKRGERHIHVYTTRYCRDYAEDFARYCRSLGYHNARIEDIYNRRTGERGGNYLAIDL